MQLLIEVKQTITHRKTAIDTLKNILLSLQVLRTISANQIKISKTSNRSPQLTFVTDSVKNQESFEIK